jgi:thiamine pyrophosphate-dependent acetolactate synthase large subunit-like protein
MRAVDALMECLKAEGVEVVFGLPGGANLPTYDAFYDAGIRHILVRHGATRRRPARSASPSARPAPARRT